MSFRDALLLGRVSNLPTVWTNALAALVLAGAVAEPRFIIVLLSMTLFYIGGMYLNDAFDAELDAVERPERPIPAGRVAKATVMSAGYGMLFLGVALIVAVAGGHTQAIIAALLLAACIILYNAWHKNNPLSPLLMGGCRMLVYITAGYLIATPLPAVVWLCAAVVLCYLIGLTYIAKQENLVEVANLWPLVFLAVPTLYVLWHVSTTESLQVLAIALLVLHICWVIYAIRLVRGRKPGSIPKAVISLIAGISLLDALFIALAGQPVLAVLAVLGFLLTLYLQRVVPGT